MNFYEVLSVSPNASQAEIRKKYLELVIKVHPDKHVQAEVKNTVNSMEYDFHELQLAWKTLANPARRFLYDINTFGKSQLHPEQDESFLIQLRMTEAAREVERMSTSFRRLLARESSSPKGLIVTLALYGSYDELLKASRKPLVTPIGLSRVVDVLIPVQCLIEVHKLILPGGKSRTKSDLPGFYNPIFPSEDIEAGLLIRYTFSGRMHQVLALDEEALWMPKKSHVVNIDALGPGGETIDTARAPSPSPVTRQATRRDVQAATATATTPSSSSSAALKLALQAASNCLIVPMQWAHKSIGPHLSSSALSQMSPFIIFAACAICVSTALGHSEKHGGMKLETWSKKLVPI